MTMFLAWVIFPLVLAALGAGWGLLVQKLAGTSYHGALLIPLGLAAVTVVAGTITLSSALAPAAVPVCAVGAVAGLIWARPWRGWRGWPWSTILWPALAAVGVILAYGAPVLLYGHPTFTGYLRLDDTATWFNVIDHVMAHGHSGAGEPQSTYSLVFTGDVGSSYPLGAFMVLGVGRALVGQDVAWLFAPYLACCGALIALCVYALAEPFVASRRLRALVAFLAAQPALLYGYALWGGIKELTSAWLLALGVAIMAPLLGRRPEKGRTLLGLGVAAGALATTLTVGAAAWMIPALAILVAAWLWPAWRDRRAGWWRGPLRSVAWLTGLTALCAIPLWAQIGPFLSSDAGLFSAGQTSATQLGNLLQPLSGFQLAGIWTIGDFRVTAPAFPTGPLVALVIVAAVAAVAFTIWRRQGGLLLYPAVALLGCLAFWLAGSTPWVMGKSLAIASPALLAAALIGGAMLFARWPLGAIRGNARVGRAALKTVGALVLVLLAVGVVGSNVRGYHDALLAPYQRMSELSHIGQLVDGHGPTFINDYEVYADRHFARAGAPTEPAEYRYAGLPTSRGTLLVKTAYADLDSFPLTTLLPYRSIVVRNSPVDSRPPSLYRLVYHGTYYDLYERPALADQHVVVHVPLGDQNVYPYCGAAENGPTMPQCPVAPAAMPPCSQIQSLAGLARTRGGSLVAYQRPLPVVVHGDDVLWPGRWFHDNSGHSLTANTPGTAVAHIALPTSQVYKLWLGGIFTRGFDVAVDGGHLGRIANQIFDIDGYAPVARLPLRAGVHTVTITYPGAGPGPGSGDNNYTSLNHIAFEPLQSPATQLLRVTPDQARALCGRALDWIDVVAPGSS
ncbi:MAG: hypothetical protein ACJ764_12490 [Solirubrobacteraceae bacterium]